MIFTLFCNERQEAEKESGKGKEMPTRNNRKMGRERKQANDKAESEKDETRAKAGGPLANRRSTWAGLGSEKRRRRRDKERGQPPCGAGVSAQSRPALPVKAF